MEVRTKIEALLFVAGNEGLTLNELANMLNLPTSLTYEHVLELKKEYVESTDRALTILEVGSQFMLSTKKRV